MTTQRSLTVKELLNWVKLDKLLIPSIQRSFVWQPKQMYNLFDSLMRGYPIGTMLVWHTDTQANPQVRYRRAFTDYVRGAGAPPNVSTKKASTIRALLDGQQRVTTLNLGVRGTYSTSPGAKAQRLFINLDHDDVDAGAEGSRYEFSFRISAPELDNSWFVVRDALGLATTVDDLNDAMDRQGVKPTAARRAVLRRLAKALNDEPMVHLQVESSNDLDRVLNIFARTNMAGTALTYVDLLMSTASAKISLDLNAEFSRVRQSAKAQGFDVSFDRMLKAAFVLLGAKEPKFHVTRLLSKSKHLEDRWEDIARSIDVACRLLKQFGLADRTLPAENALIIVASYAFHRGWNPNHVNAESTATQRRHLKGLVSRTLLTKGYWTGAVDPILVVANAVFEKQGRSTRFPMDELEKRLEKVAKSISIGNDQLDELCELAYKDRRSLVMLSLLFPHMPLDATDGTALHKDHVYPRSQFSMSRLAPMRLSPAEQDWWQKRSDSLPNLQLLWSIDNSQVKQAKLPAEWWQGLSATSRTRYIKQGARPRPGGLENFMPFWEARRDFLRAEIRRLLVA